MCHRRAVIVKLLKRSDFRLRRHTSLTCPRRSIAQHFIAIMDGRRRPPPVPYGHGVLGSPRQGELTSSEPGPAGRGVTGKPRQARPVRQQRYTERETQRRRRAFIPPPRLTRPISWSVGRSMRRSARRFSAEREAAPVNCSDGLSSCRSGVFDGGEVIGVRVSSRK